MHNGIKPKPRLSIYARQALEELLNGPLISATHKPLVTYHQLTRMAGKIQRDEIKARTEWQNDPVPFDDEIPF